MQQCAKLRVFQTETIGLVLKNCTESTANKLGKTQSQKAMLEKIL